MANVGVRVERFVRLGRGVEGLEVAHYLHFWCCTSHVNPRWRAEALCFCCIAVRRLFSVGWDGVGHR
jgi:hypothetical protein